MAEDGTYPGVYKGYVRKNDDVEKRGRLILYVPQVMGYDDVEGKWIGPAEACLPWMGGASSITFGVPPTKEQQGGKDVLGVWVMFEEGNPDFPVWLGVFHIAATADKGVAFPSGMTAPAIGGVVASPPAGSDVAELDPMEVHDGDYQGSLLVVAKEGKDIVILSPGGGGIVVGPSGVSINGMFVVNGVLQVPSNQKRST